jgi:hypothetical protein
MRTAFLILGFAGLASAAEVSVTPTAQYVTVRGDEDKFREDQWTNDGWTGGGDATLRQDIGKDATLDFSGGGIVNEEDYRLSLDITKKDLGFVRAGWTNYRHYFDSTGGFFKSFSTPAFTLSGDRHLDIGNIFVDVGLTLPNLPRITLGYERQYREGDKSLLEWGSVTEAGETRKIFPSTKNIDEHTDIFKVSIEHEVKGIRLADQFRYEHYNTDNTRADGSVDLDTSVRQTVTVHEEYKHDAFFNTFLMDSRIKDHIYWSLGYLYTTLSGDGALDVVTTPTTGPLDRNWATRVIDVDTESHVVNLNTMLGPYRGLSIYAGLQAEKTDSDGFTDALLANGLAAATTNLINSSNDKRSLEEMLGARYTKIPFTTLYAEGRLTEQQIDLTERQTVDAAPDIARKTDTDIFRQDYRVGFNTSPWRRVNLAGRYRYALYQNDYEHEVDIESGYPAFITAQDFTTEEVMGKLTVRPVSILSVSLQYQLVATDIKTGTAAIPLIAPKGSRLSGNYDASIYSAIVTVTPLSRLFLAGLFSFQDTRTSTLGNDTPAVIAYKGNVYTIVGTAGYALDNKTDVTVEYSYSRSDNFRDNSADGLPLGIDYQRHALVAGINRRFTKNFEARLRYGWYEYNESSTGGINKYVAQLASATCAVRF